MKIRVYYEDTDAGGIVYHANYIKFCERARSEALFKLGIDAFSAQNSFVVCAINAKFIKPARLGDILEVKTSLIKLKGALVILRQEIFLLSNFNPILVFSADITLAHLKDFKPARIPLNLIDFFNSLKKFSDKTAIKSS